MLLTVTACDEGQATPEPTLRSTPSDPELQDTYCAAKRQVALVSGSECPAVTGWTGNVVFAGVGGDLGKFCKYDWSGETTPNVAALAAATGVVRVASDCGSVFNHTTDAVWDEIGPDVTAAFHYGIGRPTADDLNLSTSESARSKVYVAVLDTVPEPQPEQPRSVHGEFMVSIIEDIACPGGTETCAVDVLRSLALPRYIGVNGTRDLVDNIHGGYYGTSVDMAKAIYHAVETWKATDLQANPSKLIINLSIGWEREVFGDVDDLGPRPGVAAVYAAIQYARCHGVLVIAAAGNRGYTCAEGPVAPAAWEQQPAPSASLCAALNAPTPPTGVGYSPLLYSVGGLDHEGDPMTRSRFGGMPRLAALATNAVAGDAARTMTGTSAAAAVASGTAALVWSYNPQLTPSGVMGMLYQSGTETALEADYSLPNTTALDVRAINACAALEAACNLPSASCPAVPFAAPLACLDDEPPSLSPVFEHLETEFDVSIETETISSEITCDNECSDYPSRAFVANGSGPAECPEPSSIAHPYTLPQPTQWGCTNCTLAVGDAVVHATLDPSFAEAEIDSVTIAVVDNSLATTYFMFGPIEIGVGTITQIWLKQERMPTTVRSATISILFEGSTAPVVDPLLLGP